jgi:hypothetical protein
MAIEIQHVDGGYTVQAHRSANGAEWSTSEPMTVNAIVDKLRDLGFHPFDIGDAFYAADPDRLQNADERVH